MFPSIDDVRPAEEGGPIARIGFDYQDEIAVGFLIEMLETPSILKVQCETHDDIVLVRAADDSCIRIAEYIQVKSGELDKLWSVADLYERPKGRPSIFEKSLERDRHSEKARFRIVTLRPVVSALEMLTFPLDAPGREIEGERFKTLQSQLNTQFPELVSPKGNGVVYWLTNCLWDVRHGEDAVHKDNLVRFLRFNIKEGRDLLIEPAELILNELLSWVKKAGSARWEPDRDKKIITREVLYQWCEQRTRELIDGAIKPSGGKLMEKMTKAELPDEIIRLAIDLRREYAKAVRTPHYMEPEEKDHLQRRVKSELISLYSSFIAGRFELDSIGYHALCIDRMDTINTTLSVDKGDRSLFLKGCMYDITDRCLHSFTRPVR